MEEEIRLFLLLSGVSMISPSPLEFLHPSSINYFSIYACICCLNQTTTHTQNKKHTLFFCFVCFVRNKGVKRKMVRFEKGAGNRKENKQGIFVQQNKGPTLSQPRLKKRRVSAVLHCGSYICTANYAKKGLLLGRKSNVK